MDVRMCWTEGVMRCGAKVPVDLGLVRNTLSALGQKTRTYAAALSCELYASRLEEATMIKRFWRCVCVDTTQEGWEPSSLCGKGNR